MQNVILFSCQFNLTGLNVCSSLYLLLGNGIKFEPKVLNKERKKERKSWKKNMFGVKLKENGMDDKSVCSFSLLFPQFFCNFN